MVVIELTSTVARHASSITVGTNAWLSFALDGGKDMTFSVPVIFNGGTVSASQLPLTGDCDTPPTKKATLSGAITATAAVDVFPGGSADIVLSGSVTGSEHFSIPDGHSNTTSLTIGSNKTVAKTKTTTINTDQSSTPLSVSANNEFIVTASGKAGDLFVSGGTLKGVGSAGVLSLTSGTIAPGLSPGCLSSGNLIYTGGSLDIELGGTTVCAEYDQQDVTGTISLGTATDLNISLVDGFVPALNDEFIIISNDVTDAVTGTFSGMADGSSFTVDGVTYQINYDGGDGNDVVLTATAVAADAGAPDSGVETLVKSPYAMAAVAGFVATLLIGHRLYEARQK